MGGLRGGHCRAAGARTARPVRHRGRRRSPAAGRFFLRQPARPGRAHAGPLDRVGVVLDLGAGMSALVLAWTGPPPFLPWASMMMSRLGTRTLAADGDADTDDVSLVRRAAGGDRRAFDRL